MAAKLETWTRVRVDSQLGQTWLRSRSENEVSTSKLPSQASQRYSYIGIEVNSRVTGAGRPPDFAAVAAADPRYSRYARLLTSWPGLVSGPAEPLIEDSLVLLPNLPPQAAGGGRGLRLVDVGSGGGMPGLPLALALPALRVTLLEADRRKAGFLTHAAAELGLEVEVVAERAETAGRGSHRESFDVAVCRALAAPAVALELCLPFLKTGGRLLAMRSGDEQDDPDRLAGVAALLGGGPPTSHPAPSRARLRGTVLAVTKMSPTPASYPRRPGVPSRRPLGR
jgi:16S rRNA (guanine(527)-N(7))-methyltransferase RsmG